MTDAFLDALYQRNPPFIPPAVQQRLGELTLGLIGCGLASQTAHALARLGVGRFRLWDHDAVETSNLNRQAFTQADIGENKAVALARSLQAIRPLGAVDARPARFTASDLGSGLEGLDIVINSIDFEDPLIYDVSDAVQARGGWCIQPLNLGFGGCCVILGPQAPTLAALTGGRQPSAARFVLQLLKDRPGFKPDPELLAAAPQLLEAGERAGHFPQNIIASLITSALITWAVQRIAAGVGDAIQAPHILHFDPGAR